MKTMNTQRFPTAISCKCRQECRSLSNIHRAELFSIYYSKSKEGKLRFLSNFINVVPVQRSRSLSKRRQVSVVYTLPNEEGKLIFICKKTFQETFGLKHGIVDTIVQKKKMGKQHISDNRGGANYRKYTESHRQLIREFIEKIPRQESHYGCSDTSKEYISSDLNFSKLHAEFVAKNPGANIERKFFIECFKKDFPKLSFKPSDVDTCSICDQLTMTIKSSTGADKLQAENTLLAHLSKAATARSLLKIDSIKSIHENNFCISIDLQQVIPLPTLTHGEMFYLRQLSCYNLGIHVNTDDRTFMCLWHEGIGSRGPTEIASCLFHLYNRAEARNFGRNPIVWSDNCAGQNKIMLFTYMYMIHLGLVDSVQHKFLVSGHSFLSCDRDFAQIEKKKIRRILYDMEDVQKLIKDSRKVPFEMVPMTRFYDFKDAAEYFLNITELAISTVCWIKITKPGKVLLKRALDNDQFEEYTVWRLGRSESDLSKYPLQASCVKNITEDKKNDLRKMLDYIPQAKKSFFEVLRAEETSPSEVETSSPLTTPPSSFTPLLPKIEEIDV